MRLVVFKTFFWERKNNTIFIQFTHSFSIENKHFSLALTCVFFSQRAPSHNNSPKQSMGYAFRLFFIYSFQINVGLCLISLFSSLSFSFFSGQNKTNQTCATPTTNGNNDKQDQPSWHWRENEIISRRRDWQRRRSCAIVEVESRLNVDNAIQVRSLVRVQNYRFEYVLFKQTYKKTPRHTALHVACLNGHAPVVRLLLTAGASTDAKDLAGFVFCDFLQRGYDVDL